MRTWKGLHIEAEGSGISEPLSYQVNLLGTLLGHVIREQAGEPIFNLVETLRSRLKSGEDGYDAVRRRIGELSMDELFWLIRSYTAFFNLVNEAERQEIIRINHEAEVSETPDSPRSESIMDAVHRLKDRGLSVDGVLDLIGDMDIQPTLTAHPTEARRGSILYKQKQIAALLSRIPLKGELSPWEKDRIFTRIYHEIGLLMTTDDIRGERLQVLDEVDNVLYYCKNAIWETVPRIYHDLRNALKVYYDQVPDMQPFLRYRSWIGGDRDGNPFVTPEVTRQALRAYRETALRNYRDAVVKLWQELSPSDLRVKVSEELLASIQADAAFVSLDQHQLTRYRHEPYRLKLRYMQERIERLLREPDAATYTADAFEEDLLILKRSLETSGLGDIGAYGLLSDLIIRARVFGFHLASLDIRQHSRIHEQAVEELLHLGGVTDRYSDLGEAEKIALLEAELLNPRPLAGCFSDFSDNTENVLGAMAVMREAMERDSGSIGSYIISMTHGVSDMLEAILLAKEANLWRLRDGKVESAVDVVPLFETISDLERAGGLMEDLFNSRVYKKHLAGRGNFQEIMLGYSDSNKDGGFWTANWALQEGHEHLSSVCRKYDIRFRLFHGRGGSVGRGGGRANQAIFSMPPESRNGKLRFTEQGEIISFRYAQNRIARRHLEQIVNAILQTVHETQCDPGCSPVMTNMMTELSRHSMKAYRELIDNPDFWEWYKQLTPIEFIGRLPIASRPVSRKAARDVEFDDLRAIPWVFAWTQTRYSLPGWYGMGTAFSQVIAADPENLSLLREMWETWSFFRTVLDNAQLEMARARLEIAAHYNRLSQSDFHEKIVEDFEQAREVVLKITGQKELLDNHPVIQKSIHLRNPYTDVLNLVQVELLRRWKEAPEAEHGALRHAVFLSINGISAAMQSTG